MRLIDADALLKNAGIFEKQIGGRGNGKSILSMAKAWLFSEVDNAPTINPDDLRECGRWIINPDGYYPYCSECKGEPKHGEMTNYCPNCGAKMDGKEQT